MSISLPSCIRPCASGGAVLDDGSDAPQWFPDWRTAYAEAVARNLISPTGLTPEVRIPHVRGRSGSSPVSAAPGAVVGPHGGGVAGVAFPRTPATHQSSPDRSAA